MSVVHFKKLSKELDESADIKSTYALYSIIIFLIVFLLWASNSELDSVTSGSGKIISSLQNQIVQASTSGVILQKYVRENQLVERGDKLIDIDPVDASAELSQLQLRLAALTVKEIRLNAELGGDEFLIPDALREKVPAASVTEESIFFGNSAKLLSKRNILVQQQQQKKQDHKAALSSARSSLKTIKLLEGQIELVSPLVAENLAPRLNLLNLQKELEGELGKLEGAQIQRDRAMFAVQEIEQELQTLTEKFKLETVEELNKLVSNKLELEQLEPKLQESVSRKTVRAPLSGIVKQVNYNTIGGFVNTGDVILELVPVGDDLILEGAINSNDISSVKVGDQVRIRLLAYNSIKYGTMRGEVVSISPDSIKKEQSGQDIYPIDVRFTQNIEVDGKAVQLIPGMVAEIDVLTGKRTVLEYFWNPVAKVKELALRD